MLKKSWPHLTLVHLAKNVLPCRAVAVRNGAGNAENADGSIPESKNKGEALCLGIG